MNHSLFKSVFLGTVIGTSALLSSVYAHNAYAKIVLNPYPSKIQSQVKNEPLAQPQITSHPQPEITSPVYKAEKPTSPAYAKRSVDLSMPDIKMPTRIKTPAIAKQERLRQRMQSSSVMQGQETQTKDLMQSQKNMQAIKLQSRTQTQNALSNDRTVGARTAQTSMERTPAIFNVSPSTNPPNAQTQARLGDLSLPPRFVPQDVQGERINTKVRNMAESRRMSETYETNDVGLDSQPRPSYARAPQASTLQMRDNTTNATNTDNVESVTLERLPAPVLQKDSPRIKTQTPPKRTRIVVASDAPYIPSLETPDSNLKTVPVDSPVSIEDSANDSTMSVAVNSDDKDLETGYTNEERKSFDNLVDRFALAEPVLKIPSEADTPLIVSALENYQGAFSNTSSNRERLQDKRKPKHPVTLDLMPSMKGKKTFSNFSELNNEPAPTAELAPMPATKIPPVAVASPALLGVKDKLVPKLRPDRLESIAPKAPLAPVAQYASLSSLSDSYETGIYESGKYKIPSYKRKAISDMAEVDIPAEEHVEPKSKIFVTPEPPQIAPAPISAPKMRATQISTPQLSEPKISTPDMLAPVVTAEVPAIVPSVIKTPSKLTYLRLPRLQSKAQTQTQAQVPQPIVMTPVDVEAKVMPVTTAPLAKGLVALRQTAQQNYALMSAPQTVPNPVNTSQIAHVQETPEMAIMNAPLYDSSQGKRWVTLSGADLQNTLRKWSAENNVELVWQAGQDFEVPTSMSPLTTYTGAVMELLDQYQTSSTRPVADLHVDPKTNQSTLVVKSEQG